MVSPRLARLQHALTEAKAHVEELERDFAQAKSPLSKADSELTLNFYRALVRHAENEIQLYNLDGVIAARKRACAHPEQYVSRAPDPPTDIFSHRPSPPKLSFEEKVVWTTARLQRELKHAEELKSRLEVAIARWREHELPEWVKTLKEAESQSLTKLRQFVEVSNETKILQDEIAFGLHVQRGRDALERAKAVTDGVTERPLSRSSDSAELAHSKTTRNTETDSVRLGRRRADLVKKIIDELNILKPQMQVPEDDYPRLMAENPSYEVFKIAKEDTSASRLIKLVSERHTVHDLAFRIAAIYFAKSPHTIKNAWKKYKGRRQPYS